LQLQVKIQNRKTGFTGSPKPVFGFEKTPRLTGFGKNQVGNPSNGSLAEPTAFL